MVGAGIVGVNAALTLAERGADVTVIDRGPVAGEASGLNAGLIGGGDWGHAPTIDVVLRMGSRERYLDLVEQRGHSIGLESNGTLSLIRTDAEWQWAESTVEANRARGHCHELVSASELRELEPAANPALLGAIYDPLGARAEPIAATEAFAAEAAAAGTRILTNHAVTGLRCTPTGVWRVDIAGVEHATVEADAVVVAAGPWCADIGAMVGLEIPVVPVRGQMWATDATVPVLRHGIAAVESTHAWATAASAATIPPELTHRDGARLTRHVYGRQRPNGEVVFGGDRVLSGGRVVDAEGIETNHAHVGELLPPVGELAPTRTWAGSMPFSRDGRPLIGPLPGREGLFLAGGLASSGFGRGPMAGRLVAELALGESPAVDLSSVSPEGRVTDTS